MDINDFMNGKDKKYKNSIEPDSDDILRQISQISQSEDKSFDSPVVFTKTRALFHDYNIDINQIAKDNYVFPFDKYEESYKNSKYTKESGTLDMNENEILINNKQFTLNQKLKYLCSVIQISNINIRKYDDLKQFNKFLEDKNSILNVFEPINILFDIINELIFVIQKELRNNEMLMKELKRFKYNKNENEKQIYKLKMSIKNKDKELNDLRILKNDEYYKYNLNEINELKNENKELYKKINTYKLQIKKYELDNSEIKNNLKSFETEKTNNKRRCSLYNSMKNNRNNINNINQNIYTINNLNSNKINREVPCSLNKRNGHFSENQELNYQRTFSASKAINYKNLSQNISKNNIDNYNKKNNNKYINKSNNNNNNNCNGRSIITNIMMLLKQINELLNIYNDSLSKMKINKNLKNNIIKKDVKNKNKIFVDNDNMKSMNNEFLKKLNKAIEDIKIYMRKENKNKINKEFEKKPIHVNTSKWKFRKKNHVKNKDHSSFSTNKDIDNSSLNLTYKESRDNSKRNLLLIDKYTYLSNEEDYINKIVEHYTQSNASSYANTKALNDN